MRRGQIRTTLVSVTEKRGLGELCHVLYKRGVKILASSGTKKYLEEKGIHAEEISEYTGSPEVLDGRVKTLHPKIHAGILANRSKIEHVQSLEKDGILPIDLVIVNLYPFEEKYNEHELSEEELCEFIDIGGVALIRAAAKNYEAVTVVTSPEQYTMVEEEIGAHGNTSRETRLKLAFEAFRVTSRYDSRIADIFSSWGEREKFPPTLQLSFKKLRELRYGENPHQKAALYTLKTSSPLSSFIQHQGKELSFNNYLDIIGAFSLTRDLGTNSVSIIKHTNPCGAAWCDDAVSSFRRALACDSVSAFGGIVAANGILGGEAAKEMTGLFLEVIVARGFDEEALGKFSKKKNLRVVTIPHEFWERQDFDYLGLVAEGSMLVQDIDVGFPELESIEVVTEKEPSPGQLEACKKTWMVAKHVKSNSIVLGDGQGTVGIGAGQMSRVDSSRIAVEKAEKASLSIEGNVAASDAFFPFPDGVLELAGSGIGAIIQPGGSIRDKEVVEAANDAGIAMLFTGRRHFRHL